MVETRYLVLNEDDVHEYDLVVEQLTKYTMKVAIYASNNNIWTESTKGKLFLVAEDNGDGIVFDRDVKINDYSQAEYIRLLLTFMHNLETGLKSTFRFIENNPITII